MLFLSRGNQHVVGRSSERARAWAQEQTPAPASSGVSPAPATRPAAVLVRPEHAPAAPVRVTRPPVQSPAAAIGIAAGISFASLTRFFGDKLLMLSWASLAKADSVSTRAAGKPSASACVRIPHQPLYDGSQATAGFIR